MTEIQTRRVTRDQRSTGDGCGQRSIRTQLLLAVNLPLAVILVVLLCVDYRREMSRSINEKHASLRYEAAAIQQASLHLSREHGPESIQAYIDMSYAQPRNKNSPGRRVLVAWKNQQFVPQTMHVESDLFLQAMLRAAESDCHQASVDGELIVVGGVTMDEVGAFVSEPVADIRRGVRNEVLSHLFSIAIVSCVAIGIVNVVLLKLLVGPLDQLADTVDLIAQGEYGAQSKQFNTRELNKLSNAVNSMSTTLADNDRNRRTQMNKARAIQKHLLPTELEIPRLTVSHVFWPAEDVAGDYYDFLALPDGTWLMSVADVTGHGVPAAMSAAMLKAMLQHAVDHAVEPGHILEFINRRLPGVLLPGDFASMFLARWHPNSALLEYASAGHDPAFLTAPDRALQELSATGTLLGIDDDSTWTTEQFRLTSGSRLLIFTDGVVEAANGADMLFGRERLAKLMLDDSAASVTDLAGRIRAEIIEHRGETTPTDDVTLLLMEFTAVATTSSRSTTLVEQADR